MCNKKKVVANWTGEYPCLCSGEWSLQVNGDDVSDKIPDDLKRSPMNTHGEYSSWYMDEDYCEHHEVYSFGLKMTEWISANKYWLDEISTDSYIQEEIYFAIQEEDFQPGSCGGCI